MAESLEQFADRVAAATPAPAGGSVAAVTAGLAAALVTMVGRIAAARSRDPADPAALEQLVTQSETVRQRLGELAEEDARAYSAVVEARRNREVGEAERAARLEAAWNRAAWIPAEVVRLSREVAQLARRAAEAGPASTLGDAVMASLLAAAAAAGSMVNLRLNVAAAGAPVKLRLLVDDTSMILRETQKAAMETRMLVEQRHRPGTAGG